MAGATTKAGRSYVQDIPGGTASTPIQATAAGTIKTCLFSIYAAAAGFYELSVSAASQINTANPTSDVLARVRIGATASHIFVVVPINAKVQPFQNIYVHCTGTGNVGTVTLQ